jgi:hypothetical protein
MQTRDGRVVASSDQLLHDFLKRADWQPNERDGLTLLRKTAPMIRTDGWLFPSAESFRLRDGSELRGFSRTESHSRGDMIQFQMFWSFPANRTVFPWLIMRLRQDGRAVATITKGLCAPERSQGVVEEIWHISSRPGLPRGRYSAEALFLDNTKREWVELKGGGDLNSILLSPPIRLGDIIVEP